MYGFECMSCIFYAQNDLQKPKRVQSTRSIHFRYRKELKLTSTVQLEIEVWGYLVQKFLKI